MTAFPGRRHYAAPSNDALERASYNGNPVTLCKGRPTTTLTTIVSAKLLEWQRLGNFVLAGMGQRNGEKEIGGTLKTTLKPTCVNSASSTCQQVDELEHVISKIFKTATASKLDSAVRKVIHDPPIESIEKASHEDVATQGAQLFKWFNSATEEASKGTASRKPRRDMQRQRFQEVGLPCRWPRFQFQERQRHVAGCNDS